MYTRMHFIDALTSCLVVIRARSAHAICLIAPCVECAVDGWLVPAWTMADAYGADMHAGSREEGS
jgi:hypothetical protein